MSRHNARETAFQMTFQIDVGNNSLETAMGTMQEALADERFRESDCAYIERVVSGIIQERPLLDDFIRRYARNWAPERIHAIDKNIIRLALYEIWFCDDVPTHVAINEAVELAKKYGDDDTYAFVNGILDNVSKEPRQEKGQENHDSGL